MRERFVSYIKKEHKTTTTKKKTKRKGKEKKKKRRKNKNRFCPNSNSRPSAHQAVLLLQSTPDNSNLQGKSKKVRVIGSSKKIAGRKVKNSFYYTVNILITFYCRDVK